MEENRKNITTVTGPAPVLLALQQNLASAGALNVASIKNTAITHLFLPLFNTANIVLQGAAYSFPDNATLSITATCDLFGQTGVAINAQFTLANDNELTLSLSTNTANLSFTLQQLATQNLLPVSMNYPLAQWPVSALTGLQVIFDSKAGTLSVINGIGSSGWNILDYTTISIQNAALTVIKTCAADDSISFNVQASGDLQANNSPAIGITIGLPIGILGWSVSLSKPQTLGAGIQFLSALANTDISNLLPQNIIKVLDNISVNNLVIQFDPVSKTVYSVFVSASLVKSWVIINNKARLQTATVNLWARRYQATDGLQVFGTICGAAEINYNDPQNVFTVSSSIPYPLNSGNWQLAVSADNGALSFAKIASLIPGLSSILPDNFYTALDQVLVDSLSISFKFTGNTPSLVNFSFAIHSDAQWQLPMLQDAVLLEDIHLAIDADFTDSNDTVVTGDIGGTISISADNVIIPVSLSKALGDKGWQLSVTSDYIPLPSLSDLSPFMGGSIIGSSFPPGLMDLGEFAIYNMALNWTFGAGGGLKLFAFTVQSTPDTIAWNLVPGYFILSELFFSLSINNKSALEKDVSGEISCVAKLTLAPPPPAPSKDLYISMSAVKPSSSDPWVFSGSLVPDNSISLFDMMTGGLHIPPQFIPTAFNNLTISQFALSITPATGAFLLNAGIVSTKSWPVFSVQPSVDFTFGSITVYVAKNPTGTVIQAAGKFMILSHYEADMQAQYSSGNGSSSWSFTGSIKNAGNISINDLLSAYIPGINSAGIPVLTINSAALSVVNTTLNGSASNSYTFTVDGSLTISAGGLNAELDASLSIAYDQAKPSPYDGSKVSGTLNFGGMTFAVTATYENNALNTYSFQFTFPSFPPITGTCKPDPNNAKILQFSFAFSGSAQQITLGSLINVMAGEQVSVPSPWDFITDISLSDFSLDFKYDTSLKKAVSVGLSYAANIDLGFISIDEIGLTYNFGAQKSITFGVTQGTFLGMPIDSTKPPGVDVLNPGAATKVPGFGSSFFDMQFLGLGQKVEVVFKDPTATQSVAAAVTYLSNAFQQPTDANALPETMQFNNDYDWLIAAKFTLLGQINIDLVFYDPVIYGLHIGVTSGKFNGLDFEILYKKVSDTTGVYQIDLTLPDSVRYQQYGVVSFTLPDLSLNIYTNGDFLIDLGFPYNGDFSVSAGLEMDVYTGAGGFYFGKLSNDTAGELIPKTALGGFNPVISFGIGIKAGIGKSIDKGIFKAALSITFQAILEGIVATFAPYGYSELKKSFNGDDDTTYYYIKAQASLVGLIYGEVNFVIITASVSITASVTMQLILEAYRKIELMFNAKVIASAEISLNFGLFSVSISFSFSMSITENFTIGKDTQAPWDAQPPTDRARYFYAIDGKQKSNPIPMMNWDAAIVYPKTTIGLSFLPQFSAKYSAIVPSNRQSVGVALLYIQSVAPNDEIAGEKSQFSKLAQAFFVWVLNAYFQGREGMILEQEVTIEDLQNIQSYFNQPAFSAGAQQPFSKDDLLNSFFAECFASVNISVPENGDNNTVSLFPMLPVLALEYGPTLSETVDFETFGMYSTSDLLSLKAYFSQMEAQYQQPDAADKAADPGSQSLAEFLFVDYFSILIKYMLQAAVDEFKQTTVAFSENDSMDSILHAKKHYGVSLYDFGFANRHLPLSEAAVLTIPETVYQLKAGETLASVAAKFNFIAAEKISGLNKGHKPSDKTIVIPSFEFHTGSEKACTLETVSRRFHIPLSSLVEQNKHATRLFSKGSTPILPYIEVFSVTELLDKLQAEKHFDNLAGIVSRFYLHGLRIPNKDGGGGRLSVFEASGQQFVSDAFVAEDSIVLKLNDEHLPNTQLSWLKFNNSTATSVAFIFQQSLVDMLTLLKLSTFIPAVTLTKQDKLLRYRILPKTFSLTDKIVWTDPDLSPDLLVPMVSDYYIWNFKDSLQQLLLNTQGLDCQISYQPKISAFALGQTQPVTPTYWTVSVDVQLSQVPVSAGASTNEAFVYEVSGCNAADGSLLLSIINDTSFLPEGLFILFANNKSGTSRTPVSGVSSSAVSTLSTFLLQTNFSNASNPASFSGRAQTASEEPVVMDTTDFLTNLWECSVVRSGGYYLYYNANGAGLPCNIFDEQGHGTIALLITYTIAPATGPDGGIYFALPPMINSLVLSEDIDAAKDSLFIQPYVPNGTAYNSVLQQKTAVVEPGNSLFKATTSNSANLLTLTDNDVVDKQITELFSLLEYWVHGDHCYITSNYALPKSPLNPASDPVGSFSLSDSLKVPDPDAQWTYTGVVPVASLIINNTTNNPYLANDKPATVNFNLLDVFGNLLIEDFPMAGMFTQSVIPVYTDPIIGMDHWKNVSKSYTVTSVNNVPCICIVLKFDSSNPLPDAVSRELSFFQRVSFQLTQPDVSITVSNTLDDTKGADISAPVISFVNAIVKMLTAFGTGAPIPPLIEQEVDIFLNTKTINSAMIFPLNVTMMFARNNSAAIDPQFLDAPDVRSATFDIPPDFDNSTGTSSSAILGFANLLELTFAYLKVALAQSSHPATKTAITLKDLQQESAAATPSKEVFLVRWQSGNDSGIAFNVCSPVCYAIKPVSTFLISRPDDKVARQVPICIYTTGIYIGNEKPLSKVFSNTDIEKLTLIFITAVDRFFSAAMSASAWRAEYTYLSPQPANPTPQTAPFEVIQNAKKSLAANIAKLQLDQVISPTADSDAPQYAQTLMEQQLLISLSSMYSVTSLVLASTSVTEACEASLYGVFNQNTAATPVSGKLYNYTPAKLPLSGSSGYLGTFFSLKDQNHGSDMDRKLFKSDVDYKITGLEYNFQPAKYGYVPSTWLTFVKPVVMQSLMSATIPLPLKAYPTAPAIIAQTGVASDATGLTGPDEITEMKQWDYHFTYSYITAAQDTNYVNVKFNALPAPHLKNDDDPFDLFEALAQFNDCYEAVFNDMATGIDINAFQSFAWLVDNVATAWPAWFLKKASISTLQELEMYFQIFEAPVSETDNTLQITLTIDRVKSSYLPATLPVIYIDGFHVNAVQQSKTVTLFKYYITNPDGSLTYLMFNSRNQFPQRAVIIKDLDVIAIESAWGGVSVQRNLVLIEGQTTNPDFVYSTPFVRPSSIYTPSISNSSLIDLAGITPGGTTIADMLTGFFDALLNGDRDIGNKMQLQCSYSYTLQDGGALNIANLVASLPVLITLPDTDLTAISTAAASGAESWIQAKKPQGVNGSGRLCFTLSVFSSAPGATANVPVLKLNGLYINTSGLVFSSVTDF